ncbi:Transcription antitermination protein NusB (NusB) [Fructobacillus fructosus]|uniref:16S rRNA (cytosine(967)-C(5))-methyltransferase RsmB n=1 Tax=Fructobacillus fructosus TaxID=1631 RepID=UPI0002195D1D|nr:16S rRNA (cytosine(967)-C(5))-methyltransferase RsmB [Fructobacillus fructosus]KRN53358.1 16S rRNA methyltransferase B [Fructobacillus fructosus KCTC 3544]GAP00664.1 putative rRNA methylase [Fructobacillus fructosus]CAK1224787.1 Transcription antitermination protein NusB (NusB) [Fructobacillus fructosus]
MPKKTLHSDNPRLLAAVTLAKVKNGAYSNLQLNQIIKQNPLKDQDKGLLTSLVYGTIQYRLLLEYWLAPFVKGKKMEPWLKELLLTALYQWQKLDRIPKHALFNETIEVAKTLGNVGAAKFVTAILHNMDRHGLPDPEKIQDDLKRLSITYSVPVWLVEELQDQVGTEKTASILQSLNHAPEQSVRVNTVRATKALVRKQLEDEGYTVRDGQLATDALIVSGGHVASSKAYQEGLLTVQDESAMLPVEAMHIDQGVRSVLDAAAAPGGKTTQIAQDLPEGAFVTALDIHRHKVQLIAQNAARLGLADRVRAMEMDAREIPEKLAEEFDRILVDAPCSGLGLLRRKPEIRYDKTMDDVRHLSKLQLAILEAAATKLKKDGYLVYSTCTILNQENDEVVAAFLAKHPDFIQVKTETSRSIKSSRETLALKLYPDDFQTDGFYIATFQRKD